MQARARLLARLVVLEFVAVSVPLFVGTLPFRNHSGLIITNHHVALDAVRQASDVEHDYLADDRPE